jgi:hypothetical protein
MVETGDSESLRLVGQLRAVVADATAAVRRLRSTGRSTKTRRQLEVLLSELTLSGNRLQEYERQLVEGTAARRSPTVAVLRHAATEVAAELTESLTGTADAARDVQLAHRAQRLEARLTKHLTRARNGRARGGGGGSRDWQ